MPRDGDAQAATPPLDLTETCELADRVLELVREWQPQQQRPAVTDWNDELLVAAFARGYRCLVSVRELAGRGEADDAAVVTRALVALMLRYLWIATATGDDERRDRLERLRRKSASDRATLGEELEELGYLPPGTAAEVRAIAKELQHAGVGAMPDDRTIARQLDKDLDPEYPRWFELTYARIYRTTSEIAHYGLGALLQGFLVPPVSGRGVLVIDRRDDDRAAEALGLAIISFGTLADFAEPVLQHGLSERISELVRARHERRRD